MKDLYSKRHKTVDEGNWCQRNGKISHALGLEELILLKWHYPKQFTDIKCDHYQITHDVFHRPKKRNNPKISMEP